MICRPLLLWEARLAGTNEAAPGRSRPAHLSTPLGLVSGWGWHHGPFGRKNLGSGLAGIFSSIYR